MSASWREFGLLFLAGMLMLFCLTRPAAPLSRNVFRYLFVLDITPSMNTRDYTENDLPADRLSFGKQALRRAIRDLPCGSTAGIGLFSTKDVLLLIEPLEICSHFAAIDDTIAHIDWRMAWSADSNVERGLYGAILTAKNLGPDLHLVFMTDGEQTIRELHRPPLAKFRGSIKGFLFGVGTANSSPIPKLDANNQVTGYWTNGEVDEYLIATDTLAPSAPEASDPEQNYLSSLHESNLRMLAAISGLHYRRLESPQQFSNVLKAVDLAAPRMIQTDLRWLFALVSVLLILAVYIRPFRTSRTG